MSEKDKNTQPKAKLPDLEKAVGVLAGLFQDVFFSKLASYGIVPSNVKEASDLLKISHDLERLAEANTYAGLQTSRFGDAAEALTSLSYVGPAGQVKSAEDQFYRDLNSANIAARLAANPDVYGSVLAVKLAQIQALRNLMS